MVQVIIQLAKVLLVSYAAGKVVQIIKEKTGVSEEKIREILKNAGLI